MKAVDINRAFDEISNGELWVGTPSELTHVKDGCKLKALILRPQLTIGLLAPVIPVLQRQIEELPEVRRMEIVEAA